MKAIILNQAGGPENFALANVPTPVIKDNEVLVQVKATSINPVDAKSRSNQDRLNFFFGDERPIILGWDVSGVVTETGSAVSNFKKGDEVFGMVNFPGKGRSYAEYKAAPAAHLSFKPSAISHPEAASACLAALTAWQSITHEAKVKKGDKILIHAASGGVGHYAIQMAKYLGAYVIGTSSAANKDFVMGLGADEHIDYKTQRFEDIVSEADAVFDLVGGNAERSAKVVKRGGIIVCVPEKLPDDIVEKIQKQGIRVFKFMVKSNGEDMKQIAGLLESGDLKSHISKTFALEQIPEAHKEIESGRTVGKIAITV